jgi:hypothetical protein
VTDPAQVEKAAEAGAPHPDALASQPWFREGPGGYRPAMELSLLLIVIGIILAVLVDYGIGLACILVGLVLLIWPRLRASV